MKPSTLQGPGWQARPGTLADDLGRHWAACGTRSEVHPLRAVLLVSPPASLGDDVDPGRRLMLARVDLGRIRGQFAALVDAYRAEGVVVHVYTPPDDASANLIFARDLCWVGPEGAVVARMASEQRAGEEAHAVLALAQARVPIRLTVGAGVFEGADALWVKGELLVGVGRRTNLAAVEELRRVFPAIPIEAVPVPDAVQHLLGVMNLLDEDLVVLHPAAGPALRAALHRRGMRTVEVDHAEERDAGRAMNFVALGPRAVLMPAGCPHTRRRYEALGVRCVSVDVGEYLHAAGGIGCVTGIVWRAAAGAA